MHGALIVNMDSGCSGSLKLSHPVGGMAGRPVTFLEIKKDRRLDLTRHFEGQRKEVAGGRERKIGEPPASRPLEGLQGDHVKAGALDHFCGEDIPGPHRPQGGHQQPDGL